MISAAQRRVDRKHHAQAEMQKLLDQGRISKAEMSGYAEESERADHELDWAKSRAKLIIELHAMAQAEEDAEKSAAFAESARQARQADEQRKIARQLAERKAKAAEERRRVRAACVIIYQTTANKKLSDLTVKEEQQVRACQALGLYEP
jgi:hypothetical protein